MASQIITFVFCGLEFEIHYSSTNNQYIWLVVGVSELQGICFSREQSYIQATRAISRFRNNS